MGWFGYSNTGSCCCNAGSSGQSCTLLNDTFERSDSASLGADWDEVAGDAEIIGGFMRVNDANSRIIATNGNPAGPYTKVTCSVILAQNTSRPMLFLGWANSGSYLYCTIQQLFLTVGVAGGSSKTVSIGLAVNTTYQVSFCYNGQVLVAFVNGVECSLFTGLAASGTKHGVGTEASADDVYFDNFLAKRVAVNCENCGAVGCVNCTNDHDWLVDMTDWDSLDDTDGNCPECANLPGVYLLEQGANCTWVYQEVFCDLNVDAVCQRGTLLIGLSVDNDCLPRLGIQIVQPDPVGGGICGNGINTYQQFIRYTSATPLAPDGPDSVVLTKEVALSDFDTTVANGIPPCVPFTPPETITITKSP